MTNFEVDVRNLEPEYKHTLASQAGRDVDDGREVHLSRLTVTIRLAWGSGSDYDGQTFSAVFTVDHEAETIRMTSIGDAHGERQSFGIEKLVTAIEYAERAAIAYAEDVGPDYVLRGVPSLFDAVGAHGDAVVVPSELEVADD
jgi:hypothetical protein